jgi:hypothetical protein
VKAYRAAIIATALGFIAVIVLILAVELSSDDDSHANGGVVIPTTSPTAAPSPTPTPDAVLLPYFTELDTIFQRASDESITADAALQAALSEDADVEALKTAYSTFLTATEAVFANAIASMDAMTVPVAAQAGHNAFRAAADSSRVLAAELRGDIAAVTTEDELRTLLETFGADKGPLLEEADNACVSLQETATSHGINLDLACSAVQ